MALVELVEQTKDLDLERWSKRSGETREEYLQRFLIARDNDVSKALKMVQEDDAWRKEHDMENILLKTPEEILGIPMSLMDEYFDSWHQGFDKMGRPVVYKKYGKFQIWKLTEAGATIENLVRYHMYEQEKISEILALKSEELGRPIRSVTSVIDALHWHIGLATPDAMRFLKAIADADSAHYPERMGSLVVVNAPLMLTGIWKIIRGWLAAATKEKCQIISYESSWKPALLELIDEQELCEEYGGTNKRRFA